jgi:hypothetical protein
MIMLKRLMSPRRGGTSAAISACGVSCGRGRRPTKVALDG